MSPIRLTGFLIPRILVVSALALCGNLLKADIIYTNFGPSLAYDDGTGIIVDNGLTGSDIAIELPVLTSSYDLTDIKFVASSQSPDSTNSVTVSIYADNGGAPAATSLESITLNGQLAPFNGTLSPVLTANSVSNPVLSAGSLYWIVMSGVASQSLVWDDNGQSLSGYLQGTPGSPGSWTASADGDGAFEVDGTLVGSAPTPEPGTWLLLAGGLALIAVFHRPIATSSFRLRW